MPAELSGKPRSVLVVDDDATVLNCLGRIVALYGFQVSLAEDGNAALHVVARNRRACNILLCDVVLPDMSGADLDTRIREMLPSVRTVFMTGYTSQVPLSISPGVPLLTKPFRPGQLRAVLNDVADGQTWKTCVDCRLEPGSGDDQQSLPRHLMRSQVLLEHSLRLFESSLTALKRIELAQLPRVRALAAERRALIQSTT